VALYLYMSKTFNTVSDALHKFHNSTRVAKAFLRIIMRHKMIAAFDRAHLKDKNKTNLKEIHQKFPKLWHFL